MTELEKIEYAKSFIDKLANGVNPIDDSEIPDDDIVNNIRLSRCFFYVSEVLRQVIDNGGVGSVVEVKEKRTRKKPYTLSPEQAERFEYSDIPIPATEIINRINAVGPQEGVKKFPRKNIVRWMLLLGFLEEVSVNNTKIRRPTSNGEEIGLILEERQGQYGKYYVVLYNLEAQHFIIDNIEAILNLDNGVYREKMNLDNQGKIWDKEQDKKLVELFNEGLSVSEIATMLKRGERSIHMRLKRNGIYLNAAVEEEVKEAQKPFSEVKSVKESTAEDEPKATCRSCRFARSGDCFPQKEICADYEKAYDVPQDEKEAWPEMGDASYLRQKGRNR